MDLSIGRWDGATSADRESLALRLSKQLPSGFAFDNIRSFQLGDQQHFIALYTWNNSTFALIPGGTATIGYDPDRSWEPHADELESWKRTSHEYGIEKTIDEQVADATLPRRETRISPLLVETRAAELGWEPIDPSDDEVNAILRKHKKEAEVTICYGESSTRVTRGLDGTVAAERSTHPTLADLQVRLAKHGFRFPTSDEWEYFCGAGAETLFRWGDHAPCDRYLVDKWPPTQPSWEKHRQPNAFGLYIAFDPYKCELVAEPGVSRGGDGGSMICGGAGFFVGWLTLATSYFEEHSCQHDPTKPVMPGYTVGRRVLELSSS
jgi:hypothetical protein